MHNTHFVAGPHLSKHITIENIVDMISHYQQGGSIHYKYAHVIVSHCAVVLDSLPNVVEFAVPSDARFTVVGDIHGQLEDLLTIFKQNGNVESMLFLMMQDCHHPQTHTFSMVIL